MILVVLAVLLLASALASLILRVLALLGRER